MDIAPDVDDIEDLELQLDRLGRAEVLQAELARMCECDERARWWQTRAEEHQRRLFAILGQG